MPNLKTDFDVADDYQRLLKEGTAQPLLTHDADSGFKTGEQWLWHSPEGIELSLIRQFDPATGGKIRDIWFQDQRRSRQNGPSEIVYNPQTGHKIEEKWLNGNEWHNPSGGAAHILFDERTGGKVKEVWVHRNKIHRDGGPAVLEYDPDTGHLTMERWVVMGKRHRLDGPAIIYYDSKTGEKEAGEWVVDGYLHNPTGGPDIQRFRPL